MRVSGTRGSRVAVYELHFGLVYGWRRYNRALQDPAPVGTPKPVFNALKNLIALFADPGQPHQTTGLRYTIENASGSLRHMVFQKRDGTYLPALWREEGMYCLYMTDEKRSWCSFAASANSSSLFQGL